MKKTININLGGQPFIIDEPAFEILHNYFEALKLKFTNEGEQKEILSDIEGRIAEIFTERLGKTRAVVAEEDVTHVISLMGRPEDIAGEDSASTAGPSQAKAQAPSAPSGKGEKKLFRDPDNKKVGGVIAGLCHYFGWGDPTWIRIVLVAAILLSMFAHLGLGAPLAVIYLILLIVVPEATTSAEKLQMRGQPVTIQNIEKEVKDAMNTAASSVDRLMKDQNVGGRLSRFLVTLVRIFGKAILVLILLVCLVIMFILVSGLLGMPMFNSLSLHQVLTLLLASSDMIMLSYIGIFLLVAIPLISVMYDIIRTLAHSDASNPILRRVLAFSWALGFVIAALVVTVFLKGIETSDTVKERTQLLTPVSGSLHVQLADTLGNRITEDDEDDFFGSGPINGVFKTASGIGFTGLRLEIAVSPDTNFYFEEIRYSRGANANDVDKNIHSIHYRFSQTGDSILNLDNRYTLSSDTRWRDQKIKVRIYVPEGKDVSFAENINRLDISVKDNDYIDDHDLSGKVLHVEHGKIKCINCKEKMITDDEMELPEPPEAPEAPEMPVPPGGNVHMHINSDSDNVNINMDEHGLSVRGRGKNNEKIDIRINDKGLVKTKVDTTHRKK